LDCFDNHSGNWRLDEKITGMEQERVALPLGEAARRLGLSPNALRGRLKRGRVAGFKDAKGRLHVYLDAPGEAPPASPINGAGGVAPENDAGLAAIRAALDEQQAHLLVCERKINDIATFLTLPPEPDPSLPLLERLESRIGELTDHLRALANSLEARDREIERLTGLIENLSAERVPASEHRASEHRASEHRLAPAPPQPQPHSQGQPLHQRAMGAMRTFGKKTPLSEN
jgi:DNA-binding Lrp family transcriptional regulator